MHLPVLQNEILENLITNKLGVYIDATLGFGGHSTLILSSLSKEGTLLGIDQDMDAINHVLNKIDDPRFSIVKSNFANIDIAMYLKEIDKVDGILVDLGVSSYQIDTNERGFSYINDGPLDMRMDKSKDKKAYDVVNYYEEEELANIIYKYGEDRLSRRIAKYIVEYRKDKKIDSTATLKEIIDRATKRKGLGSIKRVFQALRIEVNEELKSLEVLLDKSTNLLKKGGRIAIITFHSLEDRIVKNFFKDRLKQIHKKVILPTEEEQEKNSRSRSAKLRVAEKL